MVLISVDYMKNKYFNLYITFLPTMTLHFLEITFCTPSWLPFTVAPKKN